MTWVAKDRLRPGMCWLSLKRYHLQDKGKTKYCLIRRKPWQSLPTVPPSVPESFHCKRRRPFSHSSEIVSGVLVCVSHVALSVEHFFFLLQEVKRTTTSFVPLSQQPLTPNWCHTRVGLKITHRPSQFPLHAVWGKKKPKTPRVQRERERVIYTCPLGNLILVKMLII